MAIYAKTLRENPLVLNVPDGLGVRVDGQGWTHNLDANIAFVISLNCDTSSDIALSWTAQAGNAGIVRNSYLKGVWGTAESSGPWPPDVVSTAPFIIDFIKKASKWEVSINGARNKELDYVHRTQCDVTSASVTENVANGRVTLLDSQAWYQLNGSSLTASLYSLLVVLFCIISCVCYLGRCSKSGTISGTYEAGRRFVPARMLKNGAEWWFLLNDLTYGPCSNEQMRQKFSEGIVHPQTWVKLSWHDEYVSLHELYPLGNEFVGMPNLNAEGQVLQDIRNQTLQAELDGFEDKFADPSSAAVIAEKGSSNLGFSTTNMPPGRVQVQKVDKGSWAAKNGIEAGCRIVAVNNKHVNIMQPADFRNFLKNRPLSLTIEWGRSCYFALQWQYLAGKKTVGPLDSVTMRYYFLRRIFNEKTLVRNDQSRNWRPISKWFPDDVQSAFAYLPGVPQEMDDTDYGKKPAEVVPLTNAIGALNEDTTVEKPSAKRKERKMVSISAPEVIETKPLVQPMSPNTDPPNQEFAASPISAGLPLQASQSLPEKPEATPSVPVGASAPSAKRKPKRKAKAAPAPPALSLD